MKLTKNLIAVLATATAIFVAGFATAQEKKDEKPQKDPKAAAKPNAVPDRSAALARYLNLSDDQKSKIKPILDEEVAQQRALTDDKTLSLEAKTAKRKEVRDGVTAKVKPLLHDDQLQKWERMRNPRPAGGTGPRPAAPGAPAAPPAPTK